MKKKPQRYIIDDASDKDGDTYFVYDTKTGAIVGDGYSTEFDAEVVCDELNNADKA